MRRLSLLLSLAGCSLAVLHASAAPQTPGDAASSRVVYVTALNDRNSPVADLSATDFAVKEDGKLRDVLSVRPATTQLQIVVLVDDNGTGMFRPGLAAFAELLQDRAELSLRVVTGQVRTLMDYTTDVRAWIAGIGQLGVRPPTPEGGQLLEGVYEAANQLRKREAHRPVIVALTVGGPEQSTLQSRQVLDELHDSRASLHVVFAESPAVRPTTAATRPSDLLEGNFNLSRVIGDGPKESGGRRQDVLATQTVQTAVQTIARDLLMQYEVTYTRPAGGRPPLKLDVSTVRRGVKVIAPTRAPGK
jgi:hypothetical protein